MNWTTTSTTVIIGAVLVAWLVAGLIIWKVGDEGWHVLAWLSGAGFVVAILVLGLVAICQAQTDQIRAIRCRQAVAPIVLEANTDWSVQEFKDAISRICP